MSDYDDELLIRRLERQYDSATQALSIANADLSSLQTDGVRDSKALVTLQEKVAKLRIQREKLRSALNELV